MSGCKSQQAHNPEVNAKEALNQYINLLRLESKSKYWQRNIETWLWDFVNVDLLVNNQVFIIISKKFHHKLIISEIHKAQAQQKICVKYFIICKPKGFINAILGY